MLCSPGKTPSTSRRDGALPALGNFPWRNAGRFAARWVVVGDRQFLLPWRHAEHFATPWVVVGDQRFRNIPVKTPSTLRRYGWLPGSFLFLISLATRRSPRNASSPGETPSTSRRYGWLSGVMFCYFPDDPPSTARRDGWVSGLERRTLRQAMGCCRGPMCLVPLTKRQTLRDAMGGCRGSTLSFSNKTPSTSRR